MPRRPSATAATLEQQAAGDSEIGSMDADGREVLPDFEQVAAPLDREQKLADLDARDAALNGAVRPSERCWNPAPSGIACAYRDGHDGRHSWQFDPEPESTAQPALPDMPEPEQNEYTVPTEASFGKAKLQSTPGLRAIGDRLIESDENLERYRDHLTGSKVAADGFAADWSAMSWADTGVLVLPSGRSAHLEAGYFVGHPEKELHVLLPSEGRMEPELMYLMADGFHLHIGDLGRALAEPGRARPQGQVVMTSARDRA